MDGRFQVEIYEENETDIFDQDVFDNESDAEKWAKRRLKDIGPGYYAEIYDNEDSTMRTMTDVQI